jgi:hypothetical protein
MLSKEQISKLLNRPLTTAETNNFSSYLKIATERLEDLLCSDLSSESEERTYYAREGYRTIFTDPFTGTPVVTVDGTVQETDTYSVRQFDNRNGSWFNSIVFKCFLPRDTEEITVEADWGFDCLPIDLQLLLSKLFAINTTEQTADNRVKSKKIEDFTVTYKDAPTYEEFVSSNSSTISKYSICGVGEVSHGPIYSVC